MNKTPRRAASASRRALQSGPRPIGRLRLTLGLAFAAGALPISTVAHAAEPVSWVPGRILVQPRPGLPEAALDKILNAHGGKRVGRIEAIDVHIVQLPPKASEKAVAALLTKNKHLQFAELDLILPPEVTNDPYYSSAWHLPKIGATTAWNSSTGRNVTVAILDSGVDASHPDLAGQLIPGWNFYDNNSNTADVHGHGTRVAGTAAAASNNAIGVASVAGSAKIMPLRITNETGGGYLSMMASGITWAADRGARVANISYSGARGSSTVQSAAQYMRNKGGLVVVSAGNTGAEEAVAPSDALIVVSGSTSTDTKASWSSYGSYVDVAAPGASIWTTSRGGGYSSVSGTSYASPVTAGTIALMMAANPALSAADIERRLFSTAVDLGTAGFDSYYGHGRVDAAAAVEAAMSAVVVDSTPPSTSITSPSGGTTAKDLVAVSVAASDDTGVSRVDLHVNGNKLASDISAPYGFSWDSTSVADGKATLTAFAYDAAGNYASHSVSVTVENTQTAIPPANDTEPPRATISSPSDGTQISGKGNVTVSASASDNVGVTGMSLYIDGQLVSTSQAGSLSYKWSIAKLSTGTHVLTVEAVDAAGNKGSHSIQVSR